MRRSPWSTSRMSAAGTMPAGAGEVGVGRDDDRENRREPAGVVRVGLHHQHRSSLRRPTADG